MQQSMAASSNSDTKVSAQLNSTSPAPKVLTVSMHLGLSVTLNEGGGYTIEKKEGHLISDAMRALEADGIEWLSIGWVGKQIPPSAQDALTSDLMLNHNCYPLYLTEAQAEEFYHRFCKSVLWPTMNYSLANSRRFHGIEDIWMTYNQIMNSIADVVSTLYRPGDIIWIHDYHLLCLPAFIRHRLPNAKIGFFLHCTFPSSELFRQIPIRESILMGLCKADVIGFQTYNYCRYFLRSVSILLDWEYGPTSVTAPDGRVTRVHVEPTGLTVDLYEKKLKNPEITSQAEKWRQSMYSGVQVIVGRCQRFDKYQGIIEKLLAFDHFLTLHKEYIEKVVLVQSIIDEPVMQEEDVSSEQVKVVHEERLQLVERVEQLVGRINGTHGTLAWQPVHIHIKPRQSIENCLALDLMADVLMITPVRDGMNLIAHESVLATQTSHAPLILSEFAGAASCLGGSIIVNPYDKNGMAEALVKALTMSPEEKKTNHAHNLRYVKHKTVGQWTQSCLLELVRDDDDTRRRTYQLKGSVLENFLEDYRAMKNRMLIFDFEGTLVPVGKEDITAASEVREHFTRLAADDTNIIYVVSGKDKESLSEWAGNLKVGLCGGHGKYLRYPGEDKWETLEEGLDLSWKEAVRTLYEDFCDRTPGTAIEEYEMTIIWNYSKADQGFARWLVKDLVQVLHQMADKYPISIVVMKGAVEVRPHTLSKGSVYRQIVAKYQAVDSIYRIGGSPGDVADTFDMSASMESSDGKFKRRTTSPLSPKRSVPFDCPKVATITVGESNVPSSGFYLSNQSEVAALLRDLSTSDFMDYTR